MRIIKLLQIGIVGGLLVALAAACAGEPAPTATVPAPTATSPPSATATPTSAPEAIGFPRMPADTASPQRGGVLLAPEQSIGKSHFDVHQEDGDGPTLTQTRNLYNLLVRMDQYDASIVHPELIESWEWSANGLDLTLNLRKDVKWHDGTSFTSTDVDYNIQRMKNPKEGIISRRKGEWRMVETWDTPDDYTIVLHLIQPQPDLLPNMGGYSMQIFPRHLAEPLDDQGEGMKFTIVGTGPFMEKRFTPDVVWEWERNPNYFKQGLPYLDGIKYTFIPEEETRMAAYRTGQLHLPGGVSEEANKQILMADPDTNWVQTPQNRLFSFVLSVDGPPFDDVRVRQAAALTIDHVAWIEASKLISPFILHGAGYMPGSPIALPLDRVTKIPGYNWGEGDIQADRARAAELVREAGYTGKVSFKNLTPNLSYFQKGALITQEQLNRGPFEVEIDTVEYAKYVEGVDQARNTAVIHSMGLKFLSIDGSIGECCTPEGRRNFGRWGLAEYGTLNEVDQQLIDLFNQQSQETDAATRLKMVHDYQDLFLRQYYHIPLAYAAGTSFWGKKLHNYWPHVLSYNAGFMENKWLEQ